jgi:hypothetical protein
MLRKVLFVICLLVLVLSQSTRSAELTSDPLSLLIDRIDFSNNPPEQKVLTENQELILLAEPRFCGAEILKQWYFDGLPIQHANTDELIINGITTGNTGEYWLEVTGDGITSTSTSCSVLIYGTQAGDIQITGHPWPQTKPEAENVEFVVTYSGGSGEITVTWFKDGIALPGAPNSAVLWYGPLTQADSGYYSALVSDGLGNIASSLSAELIVLPAGTPPPQFFVDWEGTNSYNLSLNPHGAGFASILARPYSLPAGCGYANINAVMVFHRLYDTPWTVLENKLWSGVLANAESPTVTITGNGVDWSNNPTSFPIADSIFDINYAIKTDLTGEEWLWINVDTAETWINSSILAPLNTHSGENPMYQIDLRP